MILTDMDARIEQIRRKKRIAGLAPDASRMYRQTVGWTQGQLARCLGTDKSVISKMERGNIKSWIVAEAVLLLIDTDMVRMKITETPGLRAKLDRFFAEDIPINIEPSTDEELARAE